MIMGYFIVSCFALLILNVLAFLRYLNGPRYDPYGTSPKLVPVEWHRAWFVFTVLVVTAAAVWTWNRNDSHRCDLPDCPHESKQ